MSIGINLERIRRKLSLTQKDICTQAGLSENSYRRIRDGLTVPYKSTVKKIAQVLNVSVKELTEDIPLPTIKFRKSPFLKAHEKEQIVVECLALKGKILSMYKLIAAQPPALDAAFIKKFSKLECVKEQAKLLRSSYYKNNDPADFLKNIGILAIPVNGPTDFHGLSLIVDSNKYFIFYNINDTVERQIFTSFHELGHIIYELCEKTFKTEEDEENAVNQLAGYILVPDEQFKNEWFGMNQLDSYNLINFLKKKYKVSYMTIINRLIGYEVATKQLFKYHRLQYKLRTGKEIAFEKEPLPLSQLEFFPVELACMLSKALAKKVISQEEAQRLLCI